MGAEVRTEPTASWCSKSSQLAKPSGQRGRRECIGLSNAVACRVCLGAWIESVIEIVDESNMRVPLTGGSDSKLDHEETLPVVKGSPANARVVFQSALPFRS